MTSDRRGSQTRFELELRGRTSSWQTALFLFLLALAIRLAVIFFWRFDGLYGQDAYAYFDQAIAITKNLPQGQPPPTDFFWPDGYPLLIALFTLLTGPTAWAGQLAALLCGAALAPLAFLLSQDLFGTNNTLSIRSFYSGLLSGLIIAVAGQPILSSVVIMADMPALFWATLAAWLMVRAGARGNGGAGGQRGTFSPALLSLAAGAALALAIISRWLYVLMVPALGFYVIFNAWSAKLALPERKASFALQLKEPLLAVFGGIIILAPQLWLSLNKPEGLAHSWLLGWSPANFFQREFENIDGHFVYQLPNAVFYAQPAGHPAYIFPILGLASLWGIWQLGRIRQWGPLILLVGWAAPVYLFLAGIPYQNFRFGLSLYPPLVILSGFGLGALERSTVQRLTVLALIALSLAGMLAWAYPMLDSFLTIQNQSKVIAQQVEQILPPQATVITFGLTLTLQHYTPLKTLELFYLDEKSLKTLTESPGPLYLLLDVNGIESQWQGKTPQINYRWLKENNTLSQIETFPPYVLFRVSPAK